MLIFLAAIFRNILFLPHFYSFWQWLSCVIIQINNIRFLPFQKGLVLSIANVFWKHLLFPTFLLLFSRLKCVRVDLNSDFLLNQQILIILRKRSYISLSFLKANWCSLSQRFLQASTFYRTFISNDSGKMFQIKTKFLTSQ